MSRQPPDRTLPRSGLSALPRPRPAGQPGPLELDPLTGPPTDPITGRPLTPPPAAAQRPTIDIGSAPARDGGKVQKAARELGSTPIVPPASVTGRSLTLVISIMCFLACLTAGAVHLLKQSANAWHQEIASEITVLIEPKERVDVERTVKDVQAFLLKQPGIARVRALTTAESGKLLEPWLGQVDAIQLLPVPRLIAIETDRAAPPDVDALKAALARQFKSAATLDDHRHWQNQIRTVTNSFALGGFAILILVIAATIAIIVSAARSAMASNREIVEVLHFVGASDRFIAAEFSKHFLRLGIRAGFVGAASAMLVFFLMPTYMEMISGGGANTADLRRFVGSGTLDGTGYILLCLVVILIAAICMLTSRIGVYRILNSQH